MAHDWAPDIFSFLDFRAYLQAYYDAGKEHTRFISYRYLARKAGFSSPSYLRHVMRGDRNLGDESIEVVADALELDASERAFFQALVLFNQAVTSAEKNTAFEEVSAHRRFRNARRIDNAMFKYLSHWFYPAIREMAARADFRDEPEWIAGQLVPSITPRQARDALEALFELGLLVREEGGSIGRGEPTITTEHQVRKLAVGNYHRQMLKRASGSIELVLSKYRDLAAMTVCVSPETVQEIKRRVHAFRESLLDLCDSDPQPSIVFQINTQLFPLTNPEVS